MRDSIVNKAPWFALGWLGSVAAGTGLGALALSQGVSLLLVLCVQLALQTALALSIVALVPERFAGFVAVMMGAVVPFGAFAGWAEVELSKATTPATLVAVVGAAVVAIAAWRTFSGRPREPRTAVVPA